ncbi:MAG: tyrosine--tRNA ligase [Candidatus Micrarchaeota archaeon]|nr:tyrosine--tRNA ligase [Candidatus Micrarchaeota archaeon]MDE1824409.1 tyrosine--tRNA ligase [Candidatus Micrarchaeota archaeon]MDE1849868.1 tyrosine--tRNA ligase [Candidatus Micrarchaeota archaeon]
MDVETRIGLIKSEPLEEVITEDELRHLLETKSRPKHYIGLEISGMPHIGTILVNGKKINDLDKAGIETQILLADWHTMANNKLGGDWERIIRASRFYRELFSIFCPNTRIVLGSDLYKGNDDYWRMLIQLSRRVTMARATRTLVIQGRSEKDVLHVSQYVYPIMQVNDINALDVDIPHAGIDQRKVHMLAKELFKDMKMREIVPIHHHLLPSLTEPPKIEGNATKEEIVAAMKMSKSKAGSSIPILAEENEIKQIMKSAWCPLGVAERNPVLELCKYLIIPLEGKLTVERSSEHGGDIEYISYKELEGDFVAKKLHPVDLKDAVAQSLSRRIAPIRKKFESRKEEISKLFSS